MIVKELILCRDCGVNYVLGDFGYRHPDSLFAGKFGQNLAIDRIYLRHQGGGIVLEDPRIGKLWGIQHIDHEKQYRRG
jgi:hypothetical protein